MSDTAPNAFCNACQRFKSDCGCKSVSSGVATSVSCTTPLSSNDPSWQNATLASGTGLTRPPDWGDISFAIAKCRDVLKDVPRSRLTDLAARMESSSLTSAELLALAVLKGGEQGDAIQGLIDAALEEYSHGSYRVPVRVVADWRKCLFVLTAPAGVGEFALMQMNRDWLKAVNELAVKGAFAITVAAGTKVEVFECKPEEAGVEVCSSPNGV